MLSLLLRGQAIDTLPTPVSARVVADAQSLAGTWYDSQGNLIKIKALGGSIILSNPTTHFENSDTIFSVPLNLSAKYVGGSWQGSQEMQGGHVRMTATVGVPDSMRARFEVPGLAAEPFDFVLIRDTGKPVKAVPASKEPLHVAVEPRQASTIIGKWVPMNLYLADSAGHVVAPDKDTVVRLRVAGGKPLPTLVRLTNDRPVAPAGAAVEVRTAMVTASLAPSNDPSTDAHVNVYGCVQGTPFLPKINASSSRAYADGRDAIDVTVTLVDDQGTPVADNEPRQIGFDVDGTARVRTVIGGNASTIPAGQCVSERSLIADQAGNVKLTANFQKVPVHTSLIFQPVWDVLLFATIAFAGLVGGFAPVLVNMASTDRWTLSRWLNVLLASLGGALVLYVAYYFGVMNLLQIAPRAGVVALLVGAVGGYLGWYAVKKVAS